MLNGYWNVYNRDGEEFKIQVKNDTVPSPSQFEGEFCWAWRNMICIHPAGGCCPESITIEKKSKNQLVMKQFGNVKEIWMRDLDLEEQEKSKKLKFVELLEMKK